MAMKFTHILEKPLPSRAYFFILFYSKGKEPLTGYKIAKEVYGKEGFYSPVKIYQTLKELKNQNLIFEEETVIKGKKAKIIKPNLFEFLKVLNERRLPQEYRLTEGEIKILADWLGKKDLSKILSMHVEGGEELTGLIRKEIEKTMNVLDAVSMILKSGVVYTEKLTEKKVSEKSLIEIIEKIFPDFVNIIEFYTPKLPSNISEKLKHLVVPSPIDYLLEFGKITSDIFSKLFTKQ